MSLLHARADREGRAAVRAGLVLAERTRERRNRLQNSFVTTLRTDFSSERD